MANVKFSIGTVRTLRKQEIQLGIPATGSKAFGVYGYQELNRLLQIMLNEFSPRVCIISFVSLHCFQEYVY